MQALRDWLGGGSQPFPVIETDEVYPLYFMDNLSAGRESVLSESMRYNHVLDPSKLHDGLTRLLGHGDWRKLGGRLRLRADGTLEVHVPREFTPSRPAVEFTTSTFNVTIEEHKIGAQISPPPTSGDLPSLHPGPRSLDEFNPIPDMPTYLKDYTHTDRPILKLHITSFLNATIVTLIWPHAVAGGRGVKEIITAWSQSLYSSSSMPKLLGVRSDVLDGIGTESDDRTPPYHLAQSEMKGWGFFKFAFGLMWDVLWHPQVESKAICLPREFLAQLRESCLRELRAAHGGDESSLFLSEGDVLEAWGARFVARARAAGSEGRHALIITSLDVQSRLQAPWEEGGFYVQNTAGCVYHSISPEYLLRKPLGELAHVIRRDIHRAATDEQIRAQLRIFRSLGHTKMLPIFGNPDSNLMSFSNWTKFNIINAADFTPAIVPSAPVSTTTASEKTPAGKPAYLHCQALGESRMLRNCFNITGKDWDGNYWLTVFFYPDDWAKLDAYIEETRQHFKKL